MKFIKYIARISRHLQALILLLITLRDIIFTYPRWLLIIFFLVMLTLVYLDAIIDLSRASKIKKDLSRYLKKLVNDIEEFQNRKDCNTLRANVMIKEKDRLKIFSSYNMDNSPDKDITFAIGQGCCGEAFDSGEIVFGRIDSVYKDTWEETKSVDRGAPWGITKEHFEKTKDLKSIISLPLRDEITDEISCVLNLDDKVDIETARFEYTELQSIVGAYGYHIVEKLKGRDSYE